MDRKSIKTINTKIYGLRPACKVSTLGILDFCKTAWRKIELLVSLAPIHAPN